VLPLSAAFLFLVTSYVQYYSLQQRLHIQLLPLADVEEVMSGKYWRLLGCLEYEKPQAAIVEVEDVTKIGCLGLDERIVKHNNKVGIGRP
jgi:hypothetical protein